MLAELELRSPRGYTGIMRFVALQLAAVGSVVLAAAGCARSYVNVAYKADVDRVLTTRTSSNKHIAAPATLEPKLWKVGQRVFYKRGGGPDDTGYEKISVVAADPCGIWIVDETRGYYDWTKWTLCLRPQANAPNDANIDALDRLQVAIWESSGGPPQVIDFRYGQNTKRKKSLRSVVSRLLPPRWLDNGSLIREDVDVPAGHFAQAIRATERLDAPTPLDVSRWSHPDVPFDAMVKARMSDGREFVLMAYDDDGAESLLPELATKLGAAAMPVERSRLFVGLGYAFSWFSGTASAASSGANNFAGQLGIRVTPKLEIFGEALAIGINRLSPDLVLSQTAFLAVLAVRWSPFGPARTRSPRLPLADSLYVRADAGYAELERASLTKSDVAGARLRSRRGNWLVGSSSARLGRRI
jgi:hypothetical protein